MVDDAEGPRAAQSRRTERIDLRWRRTPPRTRPRTPCTTRPHLASAAVALILLACADASLRAQAVSVGGRLGLAGGAVLFEDDEANDMQEPVLGLQLGGVAVFRPQSTFSLQTELWYIQKGWTETPDGGSRRLSYVELPVFLTVSAPWRTAPQLIAGVSGSLELGCSVHSMTGESVSCDDDRVAWNRSTAQFGTWLGLGARHRFSRGILALHLLGNLNLTSVTNESLPRGYTRLLTFALSASYLIPLGGGEQ